MLKLFGYFTQTSFPTKGYEVSSMNLSKALIGNALAHPIRNASFIQFLPSIPMAEMLYNNGPDVI